MFVMVNNDELKICLPLTSYNGYGLSWLECGCMCVSWCFTVCIITTAEKGRTVVEVGDI